MISKYAINYVEQLKHQRRTIQTSRTNVSSLYTITSTQLPHYPTSASRTKSKLYYNLKYIFRSAYDHLQIKSTIYQRMILS